MKFRPLTVAGAFEFTPNRFPDQRGVFVSPFQEAAFMEAVGHPLFPVAQSNHSESRPGVVRGIHFTLTPPGTAKYVYCARGASLDIVVDIRVGSPTFGLWDAVLLDPVSFRAVYFPVGVGHAFIAQEDHTVMSYLVSGAYEPTHELAISVLDPELGLPLPDDPIISDRDLAAPTLAQADALPDYAACQAIESSFHLLR